MRRILVALALLALNVACREEPSVMESTRIPDDEGVATQVTVERIQLDNERTYRIALRVESFRARTHDTTQLLFWKDKYVQVGLNDDDHVIWIAGLGIVQQSDPPVAQYSGIVERSDDDRVVFEDGTVLKVADGVDVPERGEVVVTIDARRHVVTAVDSS